VAQEPKEIKEPRDDPEHEDLLELQETRDQLVQRETLDQLDH